MDSKERLNQIRVPELRNIAKSLDILHVNKYKKEDLIKEIARVHSLNKKLNENKEIVKIFPFDDEIFIKQKKKNYKIKM